VIVSPRSTGYASDVTPEDPPEGAPEKPIKPAAGGTSAPREDDETPVTRGEMREIIGAIRAGDFFDLEDLDLDLPGGKSLTIADVERIAEERVSNAVNSIKSALTGKKGAKVTPEGTPSAPGTKWWDEFKNKLWGGDGT
jgi:hypothetical protein